MWPNPQETADLVTFTKEILNGKFHFLYSVIGLHGGIKWEYWSEMRSRIVVSERKKALFRNSRSQMFFKIGILKNFANFTAKHLCWSLFLIKLLA